MADRPTSWRIAAAARSRDLRLLVRDPDYKLEPEGRTALDRMLDTVDAALVPPVWPSLPNWVRGDTVEWVWEQVHHVELELVPHTPESRRFDLLAAVEAHVRDDPPGDEAGEARAATVAVAGRTESMEVLVRDAEQLMRDAHASSTARHVATRSLRNRLLSLSVGGVVALGALILAQSLTSNRVVPQPVESTVPATGLLVLVLLGGMIGGLLTAVRVLTAPPVTVFDPAAARAAFRVVFGAITGLLGVLVVDSGWVTTGNIRSLPALMLVAVAFGAAQEAVTRLVERRAGVLPDGSAG